jgi:hypothetical protein
MEIEDTCRFMLGSDISLIRKYKLVRGRQLGSKFVSYIKVGRVVFFGIILYLKMIEGHDIL